MKNKNPVEMLIDYKRKNKIKQRILASEIGVTKFTLNRWLKGHNIPITAHEKMILKFLKNNS